MLTALLNVAEFPFNKLHHLTFELIGVLDVLTLGAIFFFHKAAKVVDAYYQFRVNAIEAREKLRRRTDPRTFHLTFTCPECGYKIKPSEILHIDGQHVRCPACKKDVPYGVRANPITGAPVR